RPVVPMPAAQEVRLRLAERRSRNTVVVSRLFGFERQEAFRALRARLGGRLEDLLTEVLVVRGGGLRRHLVDQISELHRQLPRHGLLVIVDLLHAAGKGTSHAAGNHWSFALRRSLVTTPVAPQVGPRKRLIPG